MSYGLGDDFMGAFRDVNLKISLHLIEVYDNKKNDNKLQ